MYFFAWLRWALPSGTRVLHGSLSIFYFGPARSHRRGGGDRNEDPLGPDDAFADGGPRRPVGRHRMDSDAPGFFTAGLPVYEPYMFFAWWYHFDAYAPGIILEGAAWAMGGSVMAVVVAIAGSVR